VATIKTQLEASGVSKFQQQMRQASGAVKAMGAELKVAEAAYQQTGDQAAFLAEKSSILKQQLEEQKKAVSAAEKALEQVKKQYGENSTQANAWRTKLAQARATLIQTETAIKNTDSAMDALGKTDVSGVADDLAQVDKKAQGAKESADDLGTSVGGIADKLDVQAITGAIDKITSGFDRVIQKAAQMGKAIWDASTDAADWADNTRDAATAAHMSTTEYQQLGYAAQFFGTSVEDLTKSQGRMSKAMASADDEVIQVGDNMVNTMAWVEDGMGGYIRKKRSWSDVLLDTLDALGGIEDASERDAIAMELFGKSYADLNGIIAGGTDEFRKRMHEAPVVSEDTVNNLADTADKVKDMNSRLETLKLELLNALSPSISTIAEAVSSLAKSLTEFVQSEEGQKLLAQLGESIENIVTNLTTTDFTGVVEAAKNVLTDLNGAFDWLSKNSGGVVTAIALIAGAVGALKVASTGLTLAQGLNSLRDLVARKGLPTGGNGGTPTTTPTTPTTPTTAPAIGPATGAPGLTWGTFAMDALKFVGMDAAVIAVASAPAVMAHNWNLANTASRIDAVIQQANTDAVKLGEEASDFSEVIGIATSALGIDPNDKDWLGQIKLGDPAKVDKGLKALQPYAEFLSTILDAGHMEELQKYWNGTSELDPFQVTQLLEDVMTTTSTEMTNAANAVDASAPAVGGAASALVASAISMLNGATAALSSGAGSFGNGGGSLSAISNLYIGNYNQNGGGDVNALAGAMAQAQAQLRRGFGARK